MAAPLYAPQGVEVVIKRVDTVCQGPTCKALRAFVKVEKRYKIAFFFFFFFRYLRYLYPSVSRRIATIRDYELFTFEVVLKDLES